MIVPTRRVCVEERQRTVYHCLEHLLMDPLGASHTRRIESRRSADTSDKEADDQCGVDSNVAFRAEEMNVGMHGAVDDFEEGRLSVEMDKCGVVLQDVKLAVFLTRRPESETERMDLDPVHNTDF